MCLYIDRIKHWDMKPLIAQKDMTVWKVLGTDTNESPYMGFTYDPHKTYLTKNMILHYGTEIHDGFHCFINRISARIWIKQRRLKLRGLFKVTKFIIPKGAYYFVGINDHIVSNKIISTDLKRH